MTAPGISPFFVKYMALWAPFCLLAVLILAWDRKRLGGGVIAWLHDLRRFPGAGNLIVYRRVAQNQVRSKNSHVYVMNRLFGFVLAAVLASCASTRSSISMRRMPARAVTIWDTLRGCGSTLVKTSTLNCRGSDSLTSSLPMARRIFAMPFRRSWTLRRGSLRALVRLGSGRNDAESGRSAIERA
jgi:hypothetical protein